jgi:hypothetical protein
VGHLFCFLFQAENVHYFEKLQVLSCVIIRPFLLLPIHGTSNFSHISTKKTKVKNGFLLSVFGDLSCFCQRDLVANKLSKTFMNSYFISQFFFPELFFLKLTFSKKYREIVEV